MIEYKISISDRVRDHVLTLARRSAERGDGHAFAAALREFDRRLRIYPQFGDPLFDLTQKEGTVRVGIIRPLSMRYAIFESERLVSIGSLPVLMPKGRE